MSWLVEDGAPLAAGDLPQPGFTGWQGNARRVQDHFSLLHAEERIGIERWVARRRHEFSSGRASARAALGALGRPAASILRQDDRAPVWPGGITGSITHCDDVAAAILAPTSTIRCIGLDIECRGRIGDELYATLFTPSEIRAIRGGLSATLLFAAKEAIYKAVNPVARVFIGFTEMELTTTPRGIRARYLGEASAVSDAMPHLFLSARLLSAHVAAVAWLT